MIIWQRTKRRCRWSCCRLPRGCDRAQLFHDPGVQVLPEKLQVWEGNFDSGLVQGMLALFQHREIGPTPEFGLGGPDPHFEVDAGIAAGGHYNLWFRIGKN